MEIERSIFAAVQKGIEGKSGIAYYSYTKNFKELFTMEGAENLEGKLTAFYNCPNVDEVFPYFKTSTETPFALPKEVNELNALEDGVIKDVAPKTMGYRIEVLNGKKCMIFQYGKFLGADWTNGRYSNMYNSAVVCDPEDVDAYPFEYCSSPIVCCDIKRSFFYPEGPAPEPELLAYTNGLEAKYDQLNIPHTAGFEKITESNIMDFINEPGYERISILQSMIYSLMKLKSGDQNCRIIIADQKDAILYWIAAISIVFPKSLVKDISFISYSDSIRDYDITGVYVPELNGCEPSPTATNYRFENVENNNSVYDFKEDVYAPRIEVDLNNKFNRMLKASFQMGMSYLNGYKDYIEAFTSLNAIGTAYYDGYLFYALDKLGRELSREELNSAFSFAKTFLKPEYVETALKSMLMKYMEYSDQERNTIFDPLSDYIQFVLSKNIVSSKLIDEVLMPEVYKSFDNNYKEFSEKAEAVEKLCKFDNNTIDLLFAEHFGVQGLLDMANAYDDTRLAYLMTVICVMVNCGKASLRKTEPYYNLLKIVVENIIKNMNNPSKKIRQLIYSGFEKISQDREKFYYLMCFFELSQRMGNQEYISIVKEILSELYIKGGEISKNIFVSECQNYGISDTMFDYIVAFYRTTNIREMLINYDYIIDRYGDAFSIVSGDISDAILDGIREGIKSRNVDYKTVQKALELIGELKTISDDCIADLYNNYISLLISEYTDFRIPSEVDEREGIFKFIVRKYQNPINGISPGVQEIVKAYIAIRTIQYLIENEQQFTKPVTFEPVRVSLLIENLRDKYVEAVVKQCAQYWVKLGERPPKFVYFVAKEDREFYQFIISATKGLVLYFCRATEIKDRLYYVTNAIELITLYNLEDTIQDVPKAVIYEDIKIPKLIKQLESDVDAIKNKKIDDAWKYKIDIIKLTSIIEKLKVEHSSREKSGSGLVNNIVGLFKKK